MYSNKHAILSNLKSLCMHKQAGSDTDMLPTVYDKSKSYYAAAIPLQLSDKEINRLESQLNTVLQHPERLSDRQRFMYSNYQKLLPHIRSTKTLVSYMPPESYPIYKKDNSTFSKKVLDGFNKLDKLEKSFYTEPNWTQKIDIPAFNMPDVSLIEKLDNNSRDTPLYRKNKYLPADRLLDLIETCKDAMNSDNIERKNAARKLLPKLYEMFYKGPTAKIQTSMGNNWFRNYTFGNTTSDYLVLPEH